MTYVFRVPEGGSGLTAQYRHDPAEAWVSLPTRTAADRFSGEPAARFDYAERRAYLSVASSAASDSIYLRVIQGGGELPVEYLGVAAYYDNRRAAVTVSLDDWDAGSGAYFNDALGILSAAGIPATAGIVTYGSPDWALIQSWYQTGYIEPASHSRNHPCSASDYQATGYAFQIRGSRDDILARLTLRHPYVTTFIEPCGVVNDQVRQNVTAAGYLVDRGYPIPPAQNNFSSWGGDGAYARTLYSIDTEPWYGHETPDLLGLTNAAFDAAYRSGGIYHLLDHPWFGLWYSDSYLSRHIAYIAGRPDIWYTTLGDLYLYHFVTERGTMNAYAVGSTTPLPTEIIPPPRRRTASATGRATARGRIAHLRRFASFGDNPGDPRPQRARPESDLLPGHGSCRLRRDLGWMAGGCGRGARGWQPHDNPPQSDADFSHGARERTAGFQGGDRGADSRPRVSHSRVSFRRFQCKCRFRSHEALHRGADDFLEQPQLQTV